MNTYKVTYEYFYPRETGQEDDIREAYVLAESFVDAERKVIKMKKGDYESAKVMKMELLGADIFV